LVDYTKQKWVRCDPKDLKDRVNKTLEAKFTEEENVAAVI